MAARVLGKEDVWILPRKGAEVIVPDGFMTMAQAGARLGVTASTVRRLVRDGHLDAVLPVGRVRGMLVSEAALLRFCDGFREASHSLPRG